MPHRLGRYTQMLLAALEQSPAIGVRNVLEQELRRPATRTELSAIRRTAHHLAATGRAELVHVRAPRFHTGPGSSYLALTRAGVEVTEDQLAASVLPSTQPPVRDDLETVARLSSMVRRAASVAPRVRAYRLPPEQACKLADNLAEALEELTRLRRQLTRRSIQPGGLPLGSTRNQACSTDKPSGHQVEKT